MTDKENWNGTPPVGTHCEVTWNNGVEWHECVALDGGWVAKKTDNSWHPVFGPSNRFRPLKSDREREIEEMIQAMGTRVVGTKAIAEILYSAGYRKTEET